MDDAALASWARKALRQADDQGYLHWEARQEWVSIEVMYVPVTEDEMHAIEEALK
jgi:hypothetical protein